MKEKTLSRFAGKYDCLDPVLRRIHRKIIPFLKFSKKDNVLDVGCGTGEIAIFLAKSTRARINGVDISDEMIDIARGKKAPENVGFILADAAKLPFRDGSFDFVYSTLAFHHMPKEKVLKEIHKKLKKGKRIAIADMFDNGFFGKIIKLIEETMFSEVKMIKKEEFLQMMLDAGFKNIETKKIYSFFWVFTGRK